jgi:hypothetical protein
MADPAGLVEIAEPDRGAQRSLRNLRIACGKSAASTAS